MKGGEYTTRCGAPGYTPNRLLNRVIEMLDLGSDAALARLLGLHPSAVTRLRSRDRYIGGDVLIRIHDLTGLTIAEMRDLMGEPCRK